AAFLIVHAEGRVERRVRAAGEVVAQIGRGVHAQAFGERRTGDRDRAAVAGELLAIALVALVAAPSVLLEGRVQIRQERLRPVLAAGDGDLLRAAGAGAVVIDDGDLDAVRAVIGVDLLERKRLVRLVERQCLRRGAVAVIDRRGPRVGAGVGKRS